MRFSHIDLSREDQTAIHCSSRPYKKVICLFPSSFWKIPKERYERIFSEYIVRNDMKDWLEERNYEIFVTSIFDANRNMHIHEYIIFLNEDENLEYLLRWY